MSLPVVESTSQFLELQPPLQDSTLPHHQPNANDHFISCCQCHGYHQHLKITPPPGGNRTPHNQICKVIEGLYISNICTAQTIVAGTDDSLPRITHLLAVHRGYDDHVHTLLRRPDSKLVSMQIHIADSSSRNMIEHFPEICRYLHSVLEPLQDPAGTYSKEDIDRIGVLVHCRAGVSRSASAIIAYLIWRSRCTFKEAYKTLKEVRPIVQPRFTKQLKLWEKLDCELLESWGSPKAEYTRSVSEYKWFRSTKTRAPNMTALWDVERPAGAYKG